MLLCKHLGWFIQVWHLSSPILAYQKKKGSPILRSRSKINIKLPYVMIILYDSTRYLQEKHYGPSLLYGISWWYRSRIKCFGNNFSGLTALSSQAFVLWAFFCLVGTSYARNTKGWLRKFLLLSSWILINALLDPKQLRICVVLRCHHDAVARSLLQTWR